jgi:hypothetical protein
MINKVIVTFFGGPVISKELIVPYLGAPGGNSSVVL